MNNIYITLTYYHIKHIHIILQILDYMKHLHKIFLNYIFLQDKAHL